MASMDDILRLDRDEPGPLRIVGEVVMFDIDGGTIAHIGAYALWRLDVGAAATPARAQQLRSIGVPHVVSDDEDALRVLVLRVLRENGL